MSSVGPMASGTSCRAKKTSAPGEAGGTGRAALNGSSVPRSLIDSKTFAPAKASRARVEINRGMAFAIVAWCQPQ